MTTYKIYRDPISDTDTAIIRTVGSVVSTIPLDPDNTDYQKYLEWLAEGNEPLPADN